MQVKTRPTCVGLAAIAVALVALGCEDKPSKQSVTPAPSTPPPAPRGTPSDWSKVTAAGTQQGVNEATRVCRNLDAWYKGAGGPWTLTFADDQATDGAGHTVPISAEAWKFMLDGIEARRIKFGESDRAISFFALPASHHNYGDGLGRVKSFGYSIDRTPDAKLIFTLVRPMEKESEG